MKNIKIEDYIPIVGRSTIEDLYYLAQAISPRVIQNINSTFTGGGVAEILNRGVPLMNQLGVDSRWDTIKGDESFFRVTKKFHNALHGKQQDISQEELDYFIEVNRRNLREMELTGDFILVHDPQPIVLIEKKKEIGKKWLWRCHIDVSRPDKKIWEFLRGFVYDYDGAVFSAPNFSQDLPIRQFLISPSIDPLSEKNRDIEQGFIDEVLTKYGIRSEKPIITQVSRFDYLKDPVGVIDAFNLVKRSVDCQLILAGGTATDDPESDEVLTKVREKADGNPDIHILLVPTGSDLEINALQRASSIIVQKSIREGFGLTVTEGLWKGKPVVASAVGGIPLQIKNRLTGLLSYSIEGTALDIRNLLTNATFAKWLGGNGREHVRHNFLITRQIKEWLLLFISTEHPGDTIYL
ncbi:MAG: glycosyltransferase [Dehalococcoidia bacterium]|nr:glycosyltransferase [Dehalococcoidia bacterium]